MSTHPYGRFTRRGMAGILGLGFLELLLPGQASADGGPPFRVHTRRDWKARRPRRPAELISEPPDRIVIHHTATANSKDRSLAHAYRLSREIQRFHMRGQGWNDTGQQLTISRGGHVLEGRNRSLAAIRTGRHAVGAHTLHHNQHTIGIENEGNYNRARVPSRLWEALVETCAWLCTAYDLDPFRAIVGHRDLFNTECPGDILYARLKELRREVAVHLDLPRAGESAAATEPSDEPSMEASAESTVDLGSEPSPSPSSSPTQAEAPEPSPGAGRSPATLETGATAGTQASSAGTP